MEQGNGWVLPAIRFVHGDLYADLETKLIPVMSVLIMAALATIGYGIHSSSWLGPRLSRVVLALFPPLILIAPILLLLQLGPLQARLTTFLLVAQCTLAFFRWLELLCGTGPKGFDRSFLNYLVYFSSPLEVVFNENGQMASAPPGQMRHLAQSFTAHALLQLVAQSLGRATGFSPFLGGPEVKLFTLPLWGWPWSLPAAYLQVLWLYTSLVQNMIYCRAVMALFNIATVEPMRGPLWFSTSVRDFWGRRWNLLIHKLMKRTFFLPLMARGWPQCGGLLAFLMSGLFHEHMWFVTNCPKPSGGYVPGLCLIFFGIQFVLCAAEAALARTALGRWAATWPGWMKTVAIIIAVLPASALFFAGIEDMMIEASRAGYVVELVWDGSQQRPIQFDWYLPPIEWLGMLALGVAALCKGYAHKSPSQPPGGIARKDQ